MANSYQKIFGNYEGIFYDRFLASPVILNISDVTDDVNLPNSSGGLSDGSSTMTFINNRAQNGGAVFLAHHCNLSYGRSTAAIFKSNYAKIIGGGICSFNKSTIYIHGNSELIFEENIAGFGGAIHSSVYSNTIFDGHSK